MAAVTRELAAFTAAIRFEALPAEVQERTRFLVLDLVGNMVRGRHDAESTRAAARRRRARWAWRPASAAVFGDCGALHPGRRGAAERRRWPIRLDFDDTHAAGTLHPGAPVIPAALAAAEMVGADGRTVLARDRRRLRGDLPARRSSLPGGDHYDRGYHPTATCGAFGAAAAAARVFGLNAAQVEDAFGIALSPGRGQPAVPGQRRLDEALPGRLVGDERPGRRVAWRARASAAPPRRWKAGPGFLRAYAPEPEAGARAAGPGHDVRADGDGGEALPVLPLRPCRRRCGAGAARRARPQGRGDRERHHGPAATRACCWWARRSQYKQNPQNVVDGQFSGPFVVACALARGHIGWDSYAWLQRRRPCARLMPKMTCVEDAGGRRPTSPTYMSGKLTVTARGQTFVKKVKVPKGEPENFLTEAELRAKFHGLADAVLGAERAAQLADAVLGLDKAADVNAMMRLGAPMMAARLAGE